VDEDCESNKCGKGEIFYGLEIKAYIDLATHESIDKEKSNALRRRVVDAKLVLTQKLATEIIVCGLTRWNILYVLLFLRERWEMVTICV